MVIVNTVTNRPQVLPYQLGLVFGWIEISIAKQVFKEWPQASQGLALLLAINTWPTSDTNSGFKVLATAFTLLDCLDTSGGVI